MTTTTHAVVGERRSSRASIFTRTVEADVEPLGGTRTKLAFTKALSASVLSRLQSGKHDPDDAEVATHRASLQRSSGSPPHHRGRIYSAKYGLSDADEEEDVHEAGGWCGPRRRRRFIRWAAGVAQHSFVSALFGNIWGQFGCLLAISVAILFIAAAVHKALDVSIQQKDNSFGDSLWESYTLFVDPGTQTGYADEEDRHLAYRAFIIVVSLIGFVWMLIFLGMVVEQMRFLMDRWRRKYGRTAVSGHTLVLGWTDNTLFLLGELAQMLHDGVQRGGDVVVLGDLDELDMADEVAVAYPDWRASFPTVRLHCRRGKPHEVDDLLRVSASAARHVIVLSRDGDRMPRMADSLCLTTLCALQCLPSSEKASDIVIELQLEPDISVAQQLAAPLRVRPIVIKAAVHELIALSLMQPAVGRALVGLFSFRGSQLEIVDPSALRALFYDAVRRHQGERHAHEPPATAFTFGWARQWYSRAVVIGVQCRKSATRMAKSWAEMAPPDDFEIGEHDRLIVIADNYVSANAWNRQAALDAAMDLAAEGDGDDAAGGSGHLSALSAVRRIQRASRSRSRSNSTEKKVGFAEADLRALAAGGRSGRMAPPTMPRPLPKALWTVAARRAADLSAEELRKLLAAREDAAAALAPAPGAAEGGGMLLLIIGWPRHFASLLSALDARLPRHSTVVVLSERNEAWRKMEMEQEGLRLDGKALSRAAAEKQARSNAVPQTPKGKKRQTSAGHFRNATGCARLTLRHAYGPATDKLALAQLVPWKEDAGSPPLLASAALVGADFDDDDVDTQISDSEAITSAILLRQLHDDAARAYESSGARGLARMASDGLRESSTVDGAAADGEESVMETSEASVRFSTKPLSMVIHFADVLTERLMRKRKGLLEAGDEAGQYSHVKFIQFHRNYLETAALSLATHSAASWFVMRSLLDAQQSETDLRSVTPRQVGIKDGERLSFNDLAKRVRGLGILVGWRRQPDDVAAPSRQNSIISAAARGSLVRRGSGPPRMARAGDADDDKPVLNPRDKEVKIAWYDEDDQELLIIGPRVRGDE